MLTTLKKRQQFLDNKTYGKSWSTECFIVQGLIRNQANQKNFTQKQNKQQLNNAVSIHTHEDKQQPVNSLVINQDSHNQLGDHLYGAYPSIVGYTASKRLGNAVKRNRAKRRLREACRLNSHLFIQENMSYVFIARSKILTCTFNEIQQNLTWSLKHIHRIISI